MKIGVDNVLNNLEREYLMDKIYKVNSEKGSEIECLIIRIEIELVDPYFLNLNDLIESSRELNDRRLG